MEVDEKKNKDRDNNTLVTKGNDLINARYKLSPTENKLYLMAIAQIEPNDKDFQQYIVPVRKFIKMTGTSSKNVYEQIREVSESLVSRKLEIPREGGGFLHVGFVSSAEYKPKQGYVEILIDPKLKPYLLDLKQRFTIYDIRTVLGMRSQFSIRIYELLKSFELIGEREIEIMQFREMLGIEPEKYKKYGMFKKRVLDPAEEELKLNFDNPEKKCDLWFKYDEIKTGRKVTSIKFYIFNKKKELKDVEEPIDMLKDELGDIGLTERQIYKYLEKEKRDINIVWGLLNETITGYRSGKIKNATAYLITLLERNALPKQDTQEDKKKSKQNQPKGNSLEAQKREETLILKLKDAFEVYRSQLAAEQIEALTLKEWDAFEEYAKNNKMFTSSFMEKGILDREKAKNSMLMKAFIGLKLREFNAHFKDWVFSTHGYQLDEINGKLRIIVQQKRMFD